MYAFYYSNLATFSFKHSDSMKWLCFWGFSSVESGAWWPPPSPRIGSLSPTSPTLSGAETTLKKPPSDQCHFLALMHVTYCHTVTKCNWPEKLQNFDVVARPFQQRSPLPSSSLVLPGADTTLPTLPITSRQHCTTQPTLQITSKLPLLPSLFFKSRVIEQCHRK